MTPWGPHGHGDDMGPERHLRADGAAVNVWFCTTRLRRGARAWYFHSRRERKVTERISTTRRGDASGTDRRTHGPRDMAVRSADRHGRAEVRERGARRPGGHPGF